MSTEGRRFGPRALGGAMLLSAACAGDPGPRGGAPTPVRARPVGTQANNTLSALSPDDNEADAGASASPARARWPMDIPGFAARVDDPGDGRMWVLVTQVDARALRVTAAAQDGALAVLLSHPREGSPTCEAQLGALLQSDRVDVLRVDAASVFRAAPYLPEAYRWHRPPQDWEFGCARLGETPWLATAIAQPDAGVTLLDAVPLAQKLGAALAATSARPGYPLQLTASGVALPDPRDDVRWLFLGPAPEFPFPADAIAFNPRNPGGVTLTVSVREGTCADAWDALRPALINEGTIVDRPGYVPAAFGARIRRVSTPGQLREVYCVGSPRGALMVTAAFGAEDGDAMSRAGPMLEAIVRGAAAEVTAPTPATGSPTPGGGTGDATAPASAAPRRSTPARRGPASP